MADTTMPPERLMYALVNPDPLYTRTLRAIAADARCSVGMVSDVRRGRVTAVSHRIASGIADAVGERMDALWKPIGRAQWARGDRG